MENYADHNVSITVSYDAGEIEAMCDWFMDHWDSVVGVSFLKRTSPTSTAEELGFKYLPQQPVSRRMYEEYVARLKPVDLSSDTGEEMIADLMGCQTGACPVR